MAYDKDPSEVARNVKETIKKSGKDVILGISLLTNETAIENINAGLNSGAAGIYLLGYNFDEKVHNYLMEIRGIGKT
jgi:DNA-binding LacI/PurR family transcriptional regulator